MLYLKRNSQRGLGKALNIICVLQNGVRRPASDVDETPGDVLANSLARETLTVSEEGGVRSAMKMCRRNERLQQEAHWIFWVASNFSFLCTPQLLRRACKPNSLSKDVSTYVRIHVLSLPAGVSSQKNILGPATLYHFLLRNLITVLLLLKCQMFTSMILN